MRAVRTRRDAGMLGCALGLAAAFAGRLATTAAEAQTPIPPSARDFAMSGVQSDQYEIEAGRDALAQSANPRVRAFAKRVTEDHTRASESRPARSPLWCGCRPLTGAWIETERRGEDARGSQKSVATPRRSQSPYRVGSSPAGPSCSATPGSALAWRRRAAASSSARRACGVSGLPGAAPSGSGSSMPLK